MGVLWGQSARYFRLLERRCYDCVRFIRAPIRVRCRGLFYVAHEHAI